MATMDELAASAHQGDAAARSALFAALYDELRRLARRELRKSGGGLSLGATTLLHEAYLSVAGADGAAFPDKPRFMAYAARHAQPRDRSCTPPTGRQARRGSRLHRAR